jgi:hypothetical protein
MFQNFFPRGPSKSGPVAACDYFINRKNLGGPTLLLVTASLLPKMGVLSA